MPKLDKNENFDKSMQIQDLGGGERFWMGEVGE